MPFSFRDLKRSPFAAALCALPVWVVAGLLLLAGPVARASSSSWKTNANGSWTSNGNWTGTNPSAVTDVATFADILSADRTVSLTANRSIAALVFNANDFGYTISGSSNLTLNATTGLTQNGTADNTISGSGGLILGGNQTWTGNGTGLITISRALSGTANLTKSGSFTLALDAANSTYTGNTHIAGGTLIMNDRGALGTGDVTISNNALLRLDFGTWFSSQTATFGNITINDGTIQRNGSFISAAILNGSLTTNGNAVLQNTASSLSDLTINGAVQVNTASTLTANVSGANSITFGGSSDVTLAAGSTVSTAGGGTVQFGARTIVGQGTSAQEARIQLGTTTTADAGAKFQVNGSGAGGLRIEGTQARVDALVTDARLAATTGTGGTLTLAYTDAGSRAIGSAANLAAAGAVSLGLVSNGGTFTLGTAGGTTGDLGNWAGLTVGTNTTVEFADDFVFSASASLNLAGGTLLLNGTDQKFDALSVTENSIIDFGGTGSVFDVNSLTVAAGVTLTIANWTDTIDYFYSQLSPSAASLSRIVFTPYSASATHWQSFDKQVTPVPEPSTYGLLFAAAGIAFHLWRRRRLS